MDAKTEILILLHDDQ